MRALLLLLTASTSVPAAFAQSAYTPEPGRLELTPNFLYFEYTDFYAGSEIDGRFTSPIRHYSVGVSADYGLMEGLAIDLSMAYVWSTFRPQDDLDGLADTTLGVRYRVLDESEHPGLPSVSVRLGGIIEGTYDTFADGTWNSLGDGASGVEASVLFGKLFGDTGFGVYGDLGYRYRTENVPEDVFASAGAYKSFGGFTARAGARLIYALSGIDLFEEGFTFADLPEAKERLLNLEGGIGYTDSRGIYYQVYVARTVWGENTGDSTFAGASVTIPFGGGRGPAETELPAPQKGSK